MKTNKIYILSSAIGVAGGADKATKLLAEAYNDLEFNTSVFATSCEVKANYRDIRIFAPIINYGHRWRLPQLSLVLRLIVNCWLRKPKLIHCVGLTYEVKIALLFLKRFNIIVWETTEANKGNRFVEPGIIPKLKHASMMLAPSQTIKNNIINNYSYKGLIEVLPFWTECRIKQNIDKKRTGNLLYVGRMDVDKGFDCLFEALRELKGQLDIHLDICGKGNFLAIKRMAKSLTNVKFHGFVDDSKIEMLYEKADFVILPSKHEGYPLSLIEACGRATPIIASKVGSIPEIFSDSMAAILFERNNHQELVKKIIDIYNEDNISYNQRISSAINQFRILNNKDLIKRKILKIVNHFKHE